MYLKQVNSTNSWLIEQLSHPTSELLSSFPESLPDGFTVYTFDQTAGRGQSGNSWESEAGKNLLFSRLIRPTLSAVEAFRITQWVSVIICQTLRTMLVEQAEEIRIKWPNDIYWRDKKVCGILIESALKGKMIDYAVAGVGVNVNQKAFVSVAPNPISMVQISGKEIDLEQMMNGLNERFEVGRGLLYQPEVLQEKYLSLLYRREGWWRFVRREVSIVPTMNATEEAGSFEARIVDVLPDGRIKLEHRDGRHECFHFKEIRWVVE